MTMDGKIKEPVRLRSKALANGNRSLYLDIYYEGVRSYEFLKLYLIPEKNREAKARNKETIAQATSIKAVRVMEINSGKFGAPSKSAEEILFFDYFRSWRDAKTGTTYDCWDQTLKHLHRYEPNELLTLSMVTRKWVEGFRHYLDEEAKVFEVDTRKHNGMKKGLSQGTKALHFQKLACCINNAVKEGLLHQNPIATVKRFKQPESEREFLTFDELRKLACTECDNAEIKRAFLFSALTGMRWSDIVKLRMEDITFNSMGARIIFRQQKTRKLEYLDISPQASALLKDCDESPSGLAFPTLMTKTTMRLFLASWVARAGLSKKITFHCARHTFAVMMLDLGTDIFTLSKLLGHQDISSTMVYAKILDKNKQAAVAKIPSIL